MTITFNIIRKNPESIEKITCENVASYEVTDLELKIKFNGEPDLVVPLMEEKNGVVTQWFAISSFSELVGLKIKL